MGCVIPWKASSAPDPWQVLGKAVPSPFCPLLQAVFQALPSLLGKGVRAERPSHLGKGKKAGGLATHTEGTSSLPDLEEAT